MLLPPAHPSRHLHYQQETLSSMLVSLEIVRLTTFQQFVDVLTVTSEIALPAGEFDGLDLCCDCDTGEVGGKTQKWRGLEAPHHSSTALERVCFSLYQRKSRKAVSTGLAGSESPPPSPIV